MPAPLPLHCAVSLWEPFVGRAPADAPTAGTQKGREGGGGAKEREGWKGGLTEYGGCDMRCGPLMLPNTTLRVGVHRTSNIEGEGA